MEMKSRKNGHNSKSMRRVKSKAERQEEKRLTALLFGNGNVSSLTSAAVWHDDDDDDDDNNLDLDDNPMSVEDSNVVKESLFQIDRMGDFSTEEEEEAMYEATPHLGDDPTEDENMEEEDTHTAAWVDEDDQKVNVSLVSTSNRLRKLRSSLSEDIVDGDDYQKRLRERFHESSRGTARIDWARVQPQSAVSGSEEDEDDDIPMASKILSSTAPLISIVATHLPPDKLQVIRRPDVNQADPNQSVVQAVNFHIGSDEDTPLLLTAGLDKTLRFFRIVDDKISEKIHGIHFPNLPIYSASFLGDTGSVVVSGRRKFFYVYDAVSGTIEKVPRLYGREEKSLERHVTSPDGKLIAFMGNDGYIILVESSSKAWVGNLKMNGSCRALCFSPDGRDIVSSGSDGDVYRWDIRTHGCKEKFSNEDGTITSSLSMSSQYMAVGAESGVVNLYENSLSEESYIGKRSPIKRIMNLKTSVDFAKFNHTGEILAMSTRREKDGLKLFHTKSRTVFSNWPTSKTPLGYVWSLDFSPGSKFMAIGNDKGKCLLYKLNHYHDS